MFGSDDADKKERRKFHLSTLVITAIIAVLAAIPAVGWFYRSYRETLDTEPTHFYIAAAVFLVVMLFILYWVALIVEVILARRELSRERDRLLDGINQGPKTKS